MSPAGKNTWTRWTDWSSFTKEKSQCFFFHQEEPGLSSHWDNNATEEWLAQVASLSEVRSKNWSHKYGWDKKGKTASNAFGNKCNLQCNHRMHLQQSMHGRATCTGVLRTLRFGVSGNKLNWFLEECNFQSKTHCIVAFSFWALRIVLFVRKKKNPRFLWMGCVFCFAFCEGRIKEAALKLLETFLSDSFHPPKCWKKFRIFARPQVLTRQEKSSSAQPNLSSVTDAAFPLFCASRPRSKNSLHVHAKGKYKYSRMRMSWQFEENFAEIFIDLWLGKQPGLRQVIEAVHWTDALDCRVLHLSHVSRSLNFFPKRFGFDCPPLASSKLDSRLPWN